MLLVVLAYLVVSTAAYAVPRCRTCVKGPGEECYNLTHLFDLQANFRNTVVIKQMAVFNKNLYYSYEPEIKDPEYHKIAYLSLNHPEKNGTLTVPDVRANLSTFTVGPNNAMLYVGGSEGIYEYKNVNNDGNWIIAPYQTAEDVVDVVFFQNNVLYYVVHNDSNYIRMSGNYNASIHYPQHIKNFIVTKNNETVYLCTTGLYVRRGEYVHYLSKNAFFRGLTLDKNGVAYAWWIDEIYKINITPDLVDSRLVKFAEIYHLGAMAFDDHNRMLVTIRRAVFKMLPVESQNCKDESSI